MRINVNLFNWIFGFNHYDAPESWRFGFQDAASVVVEGIHELHSAVIWYIVVIVVGVGYALIRAIFRFTQESRTAAKYRNHGSLLEFVWTVLPALVLVAVAFPSFRLLYLIDEVIRPRVTAKVIGHQWYWRYELSDITSREGDYVEFDSYIVPSRDLELGQARLLEVDNAVYFPVGRHVRWILGSTDVIHDWAVPSLGIKLDCVPGRLNQTRTLRERSGVFFGQCRELCGVYHGFIPIVASAVSIRTFLGWLLSSVNPIYLWN